MVYVPEDEIVISVPSELALTFTNGKLLYAISFAVILVIYVHVDPFEDVYNWLFPIIYHKLFIYFTVEP